MSVSYLQHFLLAGWSVLTGCLLGAIYEPFRLLHRLHARLTWLIFIEDLLYSLCCTVAMLLLFFNLSYGRMRMYAFFGVLFGFLLWYCTVGKLLRQVVELLYRKWQPHAALLACSLYTSREKRRLCRAAEKGFGIFKRIRRITEDAQS